MRNGLVLLSLSLLLILFATCTYGQKKRRVLFQPRPISANNMVSIPGTRVSMPLPPGFEVARDFAGLRNGASLIEIYDLPGGSFQKLIHDFTREKVAAQGFTIVSIEDTVIDEYSGRLIAFHNNDDQGGMTAIFGNEFFCAIAVANYSFAAKARESEIRHSILSIRYERERSYDEKSNTAFHLTKTRAFQFEKRAANTSYYVRKGKYNPGSPYLTVTELAWDETTSPETISSLLLTEMKKHGLYDTRVKKRSGRRVNGYRAFEAEVFGMRKGSECFVYQMVVVHNSRAIVIHGIGTENFRKDRGDFRRIAHSIEFNRNL